MKLILTCHFEKLDEKTGRQAVDKAEACRSETLVKPIMLEDQEATRLNFY